MDRVGTLKIAAAVLSVLASSPIQATDATAGDSGRRAQTVQDSARQVGNVWDFKEYVTSCMKIDAIAKKNLADLRLVREFDGALGWVAPALGLTEAAAMAARGRSLDAAQKFGEVSADLAICQAKPALCPAWAVGRTMGEVINAMFAAARTDRKTAQELLEDGLIEWFYDRPANARELLRLQAAIDRAKRRQEEKGRTLLRCEDPRQTREGVDALLNPAAVLRPSAKPEPQPLRSSAPPSCDVLKNTRASERLAADDPDGYDALLQKCL